MSNAACIDMSTSGSQSASGNESSGGQRNSLKIVGDDTLSAVAQTRKPATILLIDDDEQVLNVLGEMLRLEGHEVYTAENGMIALAILSREAFDLVITDLIMPEKEGLETIADIRREFGALPIIAISGGGRGGPMNYLETARYIGADKALKKPFQRRELIAAVQELLDGGGSPATA
ncbi:MAG: response regulator [Pseudomonadaceae bacterium]|nr:response regulator [Pseudomonadaceae bacterium]